MVPNSQFKQQRDYGSKFGQTLSEYHEIFIHAPIGIYISTPEGCFVSANPVWARMCDYDSAQVLIDPVSDISTQLYDDRKHIQTGGYLKRSFRSGSNRLQIAQEGAGQRRTGDL